MSVEVKVVRLGDKLMLFINGKKQTISRKIAPDSFDKAIKLVKEKKYEEIASMFSNVNERVKRYAKGIFKIEGNKVYAKGQEHIPAPKLVARKLFEMMNLNLNPTPLKYLNKKMYRNGKGIAAGMDIFSKINNIPMTENGNLVIKVGFTTEQLNHTLANKGTVVGSPLGITSIQHDLPVVGYDFEDKDEYVYCLVDPSDIIAYFNGNIRVGRYKILQKYEHKEKPVINVPLEELYDISFGLWDKQESKSNSKTVNKVQI